MMRIFFYFLICMFSFSSFAQANVVEDCRAIITKNYSKEAAHYRLSSDHYSEPHFGNDHVGRSIFYIRHLIDKIGCSKKALNFSKGPNGRGQSRCKEIFRGKANSRSCYIHTNVGYFFVTADLTDGVNILFNRWD